MDVDYPRALLWAFGTVVGVSLLVAASTSGVAFGLYNPAWDGASELRSVGTAVGAEVTVARDVEYYGTVPADGSVAVVLSPDRAYTDREAARLRRFVRRGGTLVVAEDFGPHSNDLLAAVGAEARVDGRLLRDERYYYRSPAMPVARNVSDASLVAGVDSLTLNYGTVVRPHGARVLVRSSGYAYLDRNRDGDLDANETMGSFPVATVESVGEGRVVVVSDPSMVINAMLDRPGNRAFVRSLFGRHERVVLDYSHAAGVPPLQSALLALRTSSALQLLLGLVSVVAVAAWAGRPALVARIRAAASEAVGPDRPERRPATSDAALVEYLADRRPDWDRERVRRVVRALRKDEP